MDTDERLESGLLAGELRSRMLNTLEAANRVDWTAVDTAPARCVSRGVLHLHRLYPALLPKLRPAWISVASPTQCPLGQLFGEYGASWEACALDTEWLVAHGFNLPADDALDLGAIQIVLNIQWAMQVALAQGLL